MDSKKGLILKCANTEIWDSKSRRISVKHSFNENGRENSIFLFNINRHSGAYPGLEAEERGQGEAIARNIFEMARLKTPRLISIIIGEGASGGALGIGVGDRVYMLENTWYSVISPESCSSILWRSWEYKEQAAEALKLTSFDMKTEVNR